MRKVEESSLSREQREVCYAPPEGTVVVVGPPGSGKTVVALHRAAGLARRRLDHDVLVYNRVLRQYTGASKTFLTWLGDWWRKCLGSRFPGHRDRLTGQWVKDYPRAQGEVRARKGEFRRLGHWGHVILDEAQDFPPSAHAMLSLVSTTVFGDLPKDQRPSLMVLADENQRLHGENSTIRTILTAHMLTEDDAYRLTKNYRNTREIAEFAANFYVGLPSGIPELPDRRGDMPVVRKTVDVNDAVEQVCRWARSHERHEIGVLVYFDSLRKQLYNKLAHRLRGSGIDVQSYTSTIGDPCNDADRLSFDRGGVVTILCFASAKGLEFDTVFLPELQSFPVDSERREEARMNMYVMTSRAREYLFMLITDPDHRAGVWQLLPTDPSLYRMEM